jgi:glycosyltransferase involved in cell wall biosynthesis
MPRVWREVGDVSVTIIGRAAPDEIQALASRQVQIAGWVHDIGPLMDGARAMVAPLTYGAGLKGKVTQALAAGVPVVTTPVGAEGLDARDGEQMLIGRTPAELAARVIQILRDDELWTRLSVEGQQLAQERCSPELVVQRLTELMEGLGVTRGPAPGHSVAAGLSEPNRPASD